MLVCPAKICYYYNLLSSDFFQASQFLFAIALKKCKHNCKDLHFALYPQFIYQLFYLHHF